MNKVRKAFRSNSKGVGLIEVLIALAILGIVAVAFLGGLSTSLKAVFISDERSTAQSLAQSQMEYVKNQDYITNDVQAEYLKLNSSDIPSGYDIKSLDRNGNVFDDGEHIIGVPWDTENGQPSTNDEGIQKITIAVEHNGNEVLTLEDYKVNRYD